jgi:hypothetical protein
MFGRERPQTGILIETIPSLQIDVQNAVQVAELRNKIWYKNILAELPVD